MNMNVSRQSNILHSSRSNRSERKSLIFSRSQDHSTPEQSLELPKTKSQPWPISNIATNCLLWQKNSLFNAGSHFIHFLWFALPCDGTTVWSSGPIMEKGTELQLMACPLNAIIET
jgi:hypothetical protein